MDSIDSLLAIELSQSDSEKSSSTSSTSLNIEEDVETDFEDNVNNEDDQMDQASDDDEVDETVLYVEEVINSTSSASRYDTITNNVVTTTTATPQTPSQLPITLTYTAALPAPPSTAKTSRFVSASSAPAAPAAAAAKGPTAPVIVTTTPLPSLGPLRPQTEYEPAASVMATRLSAQYTDTLRRRAETLIQKRLRFQVYADAFNEKLGKYHRKNFVKVLSCRASHSSQRCWGMSPCLEVSGQTHSVER